jgi:hypothetical protein
VFTPVGVKQLWPMILDCLRLLEHRFCHFSPCVSTAHELMQMLVFIESTEVNMEQHTSNQDHTSLHVLSQPHFLLPLIGF